MSTETTEQHEHSFPCNPPGGTYLRPGPCECGKTFSQGRADKTLEQALKFIADAYGVPPRVSEHWAVAYGSLALNDGVGYVEHYDDEEDARSHLEFYESGRVVRRTVIALQWEAVPGEVRGEVKPCGCNASHRCLDCATGDEVPAVRALTEISGHVRAEIES